MQDINECRLKHSPAREYCPTTGQRCSNTIFHLMARSPRTPAPPGPNPKFALEKHRIHQRLSHGPLVKRRRKCNGNLLFALV
jgi:hypothetical protein